MSDLVNEVTQMALQLDKYHSKLKEDTVTEDQETEAGKVILIYFDIFKYLSLYY